jgi:hypothetical protein
MAHEMAHVALRHGTNQASKAYLAQAGLGILGGLLGGGNTSQIVGAVGGFGLNTLFLKFSRSAESKADLLAAQTLARAGYDPMAMVTFFEKLEKGRGGQASKAEQFFSSHPAPADRAARVRQEIALLGPPQHRSGEGDLPAMQARLDRLPDAPGAGRDRSPANPGGDSEGAIPLPSSRLRVYDHPKGFLRMNYPENWRVYDDQNSLGVTFVPPGGVIAQDSRQEIVEGVLLNHYQPFDDDYRSSFRDPNRDDLRVAGQDLVQQLLRSNPYLAVEDSTWKRDQIDGRPADSVVLAGVSPVTRQYEQITLFTRELSDGHILYALFIAAADRYRKLDGTFERMLASLEVDDRKIH